MRIADIKKALRERDLSLSKKLGQHLLTDQNVLARITEAAGLTKRDFVIEIGPGTGLLTEQIACRAGHVVAIEIDRGLAKYIREAFADEPRVTIIHDDIMKCDVKQLVERGPAGTGGDVKIMGNLPYNITTPIISLVRESEIRFESCCFVVQKEIADRYSASPGSKSYSAVSIYIQFHFRMEKLFTISRNCFFPHPRVESAAIRLVPHESRPVDVLDEDLFFRIVRAGFGQRRKMLRNALGKLDLHERYGGDLPGTFAEAGIEPAARAEDLSIEQFAGLANAFPTRG